MLKMSQKENSNTMWFVIWFSMVYLLAYLISIVTEVSLKFTYLLIIFSPIVIIWVVVAILKDKNIPRKTFEEYLYQDKDMKWTK